MATDYDCWHPHNEHVNVELALKTFRENVQKVLQVLCASIPLIAKKDWAPILQEMQVTLDSLNCISTSAYLLIPLFYYSFYLFSAASAANYLLSSAVNYF